MASDSFEMECNMFCPLCRSEYKEGITVCSDCKIDLVDELEEVAQEDETVFDEDYVKWASEHSNELEELRQNEVIRERVEALLSEDKTEEEILQEVLASYSEENKNNKSYVSMANKAEEYKSSGYTLLLVGIVGLIGLALIVFKVININLAGFSSYMTYIIMSILFLIFIVVGVRSVKESKKYAKDSEKEKELEKEIKDWFIESFSAGDIDADCHHTGPIDELEDAEQYFKRSENIKEKLVSKYNELSDEFVEKLVEDLYQDIYEG